jgi:uncharacterized surface protein with fasciclin (FAS1) repeats
MNTSPITRGSGRGRLALVGALAAVALLASACSSDDEGSGTTEVTASEDPVAAAEERVAAAESGVTAAEDALKASGTQFCSDATDYVEILDRYGKLFTDDAATVGDVNTLGADLVEPRETVAASVQSVFDSRDALAAAEQELVDAQAALAEAIAVASSVATSSTTPGTTTTTTLVPAATVDRVQQGEDELAEAGEGITDVTPLAEATAEYNSAAFALQIAWMKLLSDAGCLSDEQQADAVAQVTAYTTTLQTELQLIGYYDGEIDGIYGPQVVEAVKQLQKDSGLPETGFVDMATANALDAKLAEAGQQAATAEATKTASVQTALTLTGFWTGPIDGQWTDELTAALQAFQTALGVPATGEVDAATLAAFQQALAAGTDPGTPTTTPVPDTAAPPPTTAPPAESPTATVIDVLTADGRFTTLLNALTVADLTALLSSDGQFTVFAPTDDAFAALPAGELDGLLADPAALRARLLDHVIDTGTILSDGLVAAGTVPTAGDGTITAVATDGGLRVNDTAMVVTPDMLASNGVVHAIDAVLPSA